MSRTTQYRSHSVSAMLGLGLCLLLASGCQSTVRDVYYSSRTVHHPAHPGDGSIVAIGAAASESPYGATLTLVPITDAGDLAMGE